MKSDLNFIVNVVLTIFASVITHIYVLHYMKRYSPNIDEYLYSQYIYILIGFILYYIYQYFFQNYYVSLKKIIPILIFNIFVCMLFIFIQKRNSVLLFFLFPLFFLDYLFFSLLPRKDIKKDNKHYLVHFLQKN